jgi:quinolinate synthase
MFLGIWLERVTGRKLTIWLGECHVHAGIRPEEVRARQEAFSDADLLIHPECGCASACIWANGRGVMGPRAHVLSTEGMVKHASNSAANTFVVATETGILHRLHKEIPGKRFVAADDNAVCRYMKQITLEKVRDTLRDLAPTVEVPAPIADRARLAIDRMLAIPA